MALVCCGGDGLARWVLRGREGAKIKEAVLGFRRACHERKAGENRGRDWCRAGIADRAAALRDPGLGA